MKLLKSLTTVALAAALGLASYAHAADPIVVKVGVVGENNEPWKVAAKKLEAENIRLEIVKFADYTLPNVALDSGEIDLNAFQHVAFLENQKKERGFKITRLADTIIAPLSLFSNKYKSVDEIQDGDTIAIPNDPTNGGRALKVLELAGLITLDPSKGYVPEVRDIKENKKNIKIYEVDAANTPSLLPDVAGAIINANYAVDNGLIPLKDSIFSDYNREVATIDRSNPYINIIAVREGQEKNETYLKVAKAYQTKEVAEKILEVRKGAEIPAFDY
ncbi:MAG: methionine ABC transporter membrane-anchored lipoprotein MetQ [Succinivibrio sp.]|nr:methionine ABC transporter membrane-anchored lipoprotein MetQ [Succinivibrio sp.]